MLSVKQCVYATQTPGAAYNGRFHALVASAPALVRGSKQSRPLPVVVDPEAVLCSVLYLHCLLQGH